MSEEIEEKLFDTSRSYELDKAWMGIQYCLSGGKWNEENKIPTNIIFGGEYLVDDDENIITLKNQEDIKRIVSFLYDNNLQEMIRNNFWKIDDEDFQYKDENGLEHALEWSEEILPFYENALNGNYQVIFTVDL